MAQRELYNSLNPGKVQSIQPKTITADEQGTSADLAGYNSALVEFNFGASGDTLSGTVYAQAVLEESDNDSTYTAVAAGDMVGTLPLVDDPAEDSTIYMVAYLGKKRYIRPTVDLTGTHTNGLPVAVAIYRAHKYDLNVG